MEDESNMLLRELVAMHNIQENPDFEEQIAEILEKYVVFSKKRLSHKENLVVQELNV